MSTKRPARKGNPDLRQQKHLPAPPIEEIDKQLYSLLSPGSFEPLKLCEGKDKKKLRRRSPPQASRILTLPVMISNPCQQKVRLVSVLWGATWY